MKTSLTLSSIYGSDAIAGATNIITKKDFDGVGGAFWFNLLRPARLT